MAARKKVARAPVCSPDPDQERRVVSFLADARFEDELLEQIDNAVRLVSDVPQLCPAECVYEQRPILQGERPLSESIVWEPKIQNVPLGTPGQHLAKIRLEDTMYQPGGGRNTIVSLGSINLLEAQRVAVALYLSSPLARRIVSVWHFLTIGKGLRVNFRDTRGNPAPGKDRAWKQIENLANKRLKHAIQHALMLGEGFSMRFGSGKNMRVRWLEPDRVPTIYVDAEDAEDVQAYGWNRHDGSLVAAKAEDVIHWRAGEIGNVPRSIPPMLPAMRWIREADLFAENRMWVNKIRARYPLLMKIDGNAGQITTEKNRQETQGLPKPGSVLNLPPGYEPVYPPLNVGASDVAEDLRMLLEWVATASNIPLFILVPSADGANYSSTITQESPLVVFIESIQEAFTPSALRLISWMSGTPEDQIIIEWPSVIRRGIGELTAALGVGVQNQFLSRQSAAEAIGRTWHGPDGEQERIAREQTEAMWGAEFGGDEAPSPFQKKVDGGVGSAPSGTSQGAAAGKSQGMKPSVDEPS